MPPAAVGLRTHSGWAAAVAIGGPLQAPVVIQRARIQMMDGAGAIKQPYHAAAETEGAEAERIVGDCARQAAALAGTGLRALIHDLRALEYQAAG